MIGKTQQAVASWELGERRPKVETAKRIASVLGFDWQLFYPDEPEGEPENARQGCGDKSA